MKKEIQISSVELEPLAAGLGQTFIRRWDMYPRQLDTGSYLCIKKPLTQKNILAHLRGDITIGAYLLDPDSRASFIVIDADDEQEYAQVAGMAASLAQRGVPTYLELSRRGGHLWFFFEVPIPGKEARSFGRGMLAAHNLPKEIELYPKQDALRNGPGSLIRLPFGVHRKDGNRYGFVRPSGEPIAPALREQIPMLFNPQTVPAVAFIEFLKLDQPKPQTPDFAPSEAQRDTLSQSIKAAITVQEFVGQYIELTPAGRGHCPFHDDRNRSFSVNAEQNYWHCFAGCGGGSVIDFWMQRQGCDFTTAICELARMLLK
jgi:hypothetical protein